MSNTSDFEQMDRADLARACQQLSERYFGDRPATTNPEPIAMPNVQSGRASFQKGQALRGVIGLGLAMCIMAAAFVWQSSYREEAKQVVARWAPEFVVASLASTGKPTPDAQPIRSVRAEMETAPQQLAPAPQSQMLPGPAPVADAASSEGRELIESMKRELANVQQQIEKLRAGQEQTAKDNAELKETQEQAARNNTSSAEQLKANQEQLARLEVAISKQNLRPKISAPQSGRTPAR